MATTTKTQTAVQDATAQVQEINERLVDASKKVANEYLNLTEKTAQSIVGVQRQVAEQTDVEWVAAVIEAQAKFTADVTKVVVSSTRDLLKQHPPSAGPPSPRRRGRPRSRRGAFGLRAHRVRARPAVTLSGGRPAGRRLVLLAPGLM